MPHSRTLRVFLALALCLLMTIAAAAAEKLAKPELRIAGDAASGKPALTWASVSGAIRYRVYRSGNGVDFERIASTDGTRYIDEDAAAGRTYVYRIRAVAQDENDNSSYSKEKGFTCTLPCPAVSVVQNAENGRQKLTWARVDGAKEYAIYRSETSGDGYQHVKTTQKTGWTDTTAVLGRTYYYKVRALAGQSALNSALSEEVTGCYALLRDLVLTAEANGAGQPALKWNQVQDAVRYRIYRRIGEEGDFSFLAQTTKRQHTDEDTPPGVACTYKVTAYDADGGRVSASGSVSVTTASRAGERLVTRYVSVPHIDLYQSPHAGHKSLSARYMDEIVLWQRSGDEEVNNRCRVLYGGQLYYLCTEDRDKRLTDAKTAFSYTGLTDIQQEVIDLALEISEAWTTTYAHGQSNGIPDENGVFGFDCTGLVKYIFTSVMQPRIPTYRLYAGIDTLHGMKSVCNEGYPGELKVVSVSRKDLQPGDVLFFSSYADGSASTEIGHCGIYLGNNEFVHSTSAWDDSVCIIPLSGDYQRNFKGAKRYLPAQIVSADTPVVIDGPYNTYKVYAAKNSAAEVVAAPRQGDALTLLYTDNGSWAYVRTQDGTEGFILASHLK